MASTSVDIANLALGRIGAKTITSLTQSGSNEATKVNNVYTDILKEVLEEHPWTFAQKRLALTATVPDDTSRTIDDTEYTPVTITGATAANPVVITAAAHGLSDGDWVKITDVSGMTELNGNFYIVDDATTNTFSLNDTDGNNVDGSAYSAYSSGGQIQKCPELVTIDTYTPVVYEKPSDLVKLIKKSDEDAYISVERDKIISDTASLKIIYTYLNTTVTQYSPKFVQALATRLAAEVAFTIMNSVSKSRELKEAYEKIDLLRAIQADSTRGTPNEVTQDEWEDARIIGTYPVTSGETWHYA